MLCALAAAVPPSVRAHAQPPWTTTVFARVPAPGFPAMSFVHPGGDVFEGTYDNPAGSTAPSKVFEFSATGVPVRSWTLPGETLNGPHGVQVATSDALGRLVLLELGPPRAVLLDVHTGALTPYASFADLPACIPPQTPPACSPTVQNLAPEPDYAAWGGDGSLYVTDYQQAVIWRVPPGGGAARVWLADRRLDGEQFGTAGLSFLADHRTLLFTQGSNAGGGDGDPTTGKLDAVTVQADGTPGPIRRLWESHPADAPDGLAVALSGHVYIALVSPTANQVVEVAADGTELARYPSVPATGADGTSIPFDDPSSARFLGSSLLVANQSYVAGDPKHWAILRVDVGEPGLPEVIPASAGLPVTATPRPTASPSATATPAPGVIQPGLANTAAAGSAPSAALAALPLAVVASRRRRRPAARPCRDHRARRRA